VSWLRGNSLVQREFHVRGHAQLQQVQVGFGKWSRASSYIRTADSKGESGEMVFDAPHRVAEIQQAGGFSRSFSKRSRRRRSRWSRKVGISFAGPRDEERPGDGMCEVSCASMPWLSPRLNEGLVSMIVSETLTDR